MAIDTGRARAPYASDPRCSHGRLHAEAESPRRNVFRRDCDRVIHTAAFRRLKHKTQVFVLHEGDHYRTRLTHTLEVTQIARSLARSLGLDEDLAEALALAHDLGHPPFGHAGETALDTCLGAFGGFDHNVQTLRLVTSLERRYAAFDGLNLTWETLEGLIKHNGALTDRAGAAIGRYRVGGVPIAIRRAAGLLDVPLWTQTGPEGQVGPIADDIAYDAHDLDDGLRAGLFATSDLAGLPLVGETLAQLQGEYPRIEHARLVHELIRRLIARMIEDVVVASELRLATLAPSSPADVRAAAHPVFGFSAETAAVDRAIKAFLFPHMYRHSSVTRITDSAQAVVHDLFSHFTARPQDMPAGWFEGLDDANEDVRARRIGDFIAGMTDRFALAEHAKYFDSTPELR